MKKYFLVAFTFTVFLLGGSLAYGDDTADLFAAWAPPNIIFILGNSSSMFTLPCNDNSPGNLGCTDFFAAELSRCTEEGPSTTCFSPTGDYDPDPDEPDLFINDESGEKLTRAEYKTRYQTGWVYYQGDYNSRWKVAARSIDDFCTTMGEDSQCLDKGYYKKTSGENQGYYFTGRFLRFYPPKYVIVRRVMKDVVLDTATIRMAFVTFTSGSNPFGGEFIWGLNPECNLLDSDNENWGRNRGRIISNINNNLIFDSDGPIYAPLAETLLNAGQHYAPKDHFKTTLGFGEGYVKAEFDSSQEGVGNQDSICVWCQKNFVIIITDGVPTKDQKIPESLKNYDDDCNECEVSGPTTATVCQPLKVDGCTTPCDDLRCYNDEGSDYLDDVAKFLNGNDLRPDVGCGEDPTNRTCNKQNVFTYVVGFAVDHPLLSETARNGGGLYLTANNAAELAQKLKAALNDIIRRSASFTVPAVPSARVKDIRKTTTGLTSDDRIYLASFMPTRQGPYKGHLRAYYVDCKGHIVGGKDCNPEAAACENNCELVVTTTVTDGQGNVIRIDYTSECDDCHLATDKDGKIVDDEGNLFNPEAHPIWDAGECLSLNCKEHPGECGMDSSDLNRCFVSADDRNIYTAVDTDGDNKPDNRIRFHTDNAETLFPLLAYGTTVADAVRLINYVRGEDAFDEDEDGNTDEERDWKLGDVFHSSPVLVGQSNPLYYDFGFTCECKGNICYGESESQDSSKGFRNSEEIMLRPKMLIVGANDGMLHCFNAGDAAKIDPGKQDEASTACKLEDLKDNIKYVDDVDAGKEMWAFIPPNLLPKLKDMIDSNAHEYYVDGTPVVSDVYSGGESFGAKRKRNWRTVVVCGEREGGEHYFALDITYPNNNDPDDGTYSCPRFLWDFTDPKMGFTWSEALHGAEYGRIKLANETEKWVAMMGGGLSPRGPNTDLEPNTGNAFFVVDVASGDLIWEFSNGDDEKMTYDIPSTPTPVDWDFVGNDGFIDWVYIGDLGGQMWKMDLSSENTSGWSGQIFFEADTSISDQPIYFRPSFTTGKRGNLWIYFGTGDRNNPKDLKDSQVRDIFNRFYGIMDFDDLEDANGDKIQTSPPPPFEEGDLTDVTNPGVTPINDPTQLHGQGWYIRLAGQELYDNENHQGEKAMPKSSVLMGKTYFTTYTPPGGEVYDPCGGGVLGEARLYVVGYESGAAEGEFEGGWRSTVIGEGIPSPVIITAEIVGGKVVLKAMVSSSSGELTQTEVPAPPRPCGILSWKEVFGE